MRERSRPENAVGPRAEPLDVGTVGLRPVYLRPRSTERLRHRTLASALVTLCLVLACRGSDSPRVEPPATPRFPTPEPVAKQAPTEGEDELVEVEPIATERLLPSKETRDRPGTEPKGPLILRVGLATDLPRLDLPCCDPRIGVRIDGIPLPLDRPTSVAPAADVGRTVSYRLQVAALKDEKQAQGIADYLGASTDFPTESVFDADTDLYRVRVGRFPNRAAAEAARGQLAGLGVTEGWVVSEGGELKDPALVVIQGERRWRVPGRWLEIGVIPGAPGNARGTGHEREIGLPFEHTRYRGNLLVFLNERGQLNVINELELEQYLRGVVPKEMGPELYNQVQALEAQTVAARTYTLRNLGEFGDEGYDICSTPRCQVYGGMGVEHPVSDRAIEETAGQVLLYDGRPAETFYSATCGRHTENVEVIFPLKKGPYLRGAPCLEAGTTLLRGELATGSSWPGGLVRELLPSAASDPTAALGDRLEHLAALAGLPMPADRLRSLERAEVIRYVRSLFDLVLDRRLTQSHERLDALLEQPPSDWQYRDRRLASFLRFGRWLIPENDQPPSELELETLLLELALYLDVLREERGHFLALDAAPSSGPSGEPSHLRIRQGDRQEVFELDDHFATFRRRNGSIGESTLDLLAGDRLRLYLRGDRPLALLQPLDSPPVVFGKRAPKQSWTLFKTDDQLRKAVQKRYPGFPFVRFEILERGVSGRVGKIALVADDGRRIEVEGLAVRWTLDVWDTQFQVERTNSASGKPGWLFRGRGWGHGVGMCQAGAFGMAVRGLTYREILQHYYTGAELGRLEPAPPRPRLPTG